VLGNVTVDMVVGGMRGIPVSLAAVREERDGAGSCCCRARCAQKNLY